MCTAAKDGICVNQGEKKVEVKNRTQSRLWQYDALRIFSVFCMMLLHVAAARWDQEPVQSLAWQVFNFYDSAMRFCVPVFVMLSGVFFLDKNRSYTLRTLLTKNILRIVTAFIFWSAAYSVLDNLFEYQTINGDFFRSAANQFLKGHFHMWFLFIIVGLYLLVPILRKISEDKKLTEYFIVLALVFNSILPMLQLIPPLKSIVKFYVYELDLHMVMGFSGLFLAGQYFNTYPVSRRLKGIIYTLGALSIPFTVCLTSAISLKDGAPSKALYDYLGLNVVFTAVSVFLLFKDRAAKLNPSPRIRKITSLLARLSFGMYLVHDFVNILLVKFLHITTVSFNPVFSVPLITALVFCISFAITYCISKIPVISKYII